MGEVELEPDTPIEVAPGVLKPYGDCTAEELEGALELLRASGADRIPEQTALGEEEREAHVEAVKAAQDEEQARIAAHIQLIEDEIDTRSGTL